MLIKDFQRLGFTEKEAQAYLMLLRIGVSPASSLAKRLNVKRVTIYSVLDSLVIKGLAEFTELKSGRRFEAMEPECLIEHFNRQQTKLRFQMNLAQECVEKLQKLPRPKDSLKLKVKTFEEPKLILIKLIKSFEKLDEISIFLPSLNDKTDLPKVLSEFLKKMIFLAKKVQIFSTKEDCESLMKVFPKARYEHVSDAGSLTQGQSDLIIGKGVVCFLSETENKSAHLLYMNNPGYASSLKFLLESKKI
jgi:predicted transcriptional regulator